MYNTLPSRMRSEACLAAQTRRVHRAICATYDERLQAEGLTIAQLDVLVTLLYLDRPVRPIDLAREMLAQRSTVSRNLKRLESSGFVQLRPGGSARERLVVVTPEGQSIVTRAETAWVEAQEVTRSMLGPEGVQALELMSELVGRKES